MNKKYDYAVVIGRFQLPHVGHLELFKKAEELSDNIIVIIGSSNEAKTIKNPFSFQQRVDFLRHGYSKGLNYTQSPAYFFKPVQDTLYSDNKWVRDVEQAIEEVTNNNKNVTIVGCKKSSDESYLEWFNHKYHSELVDVTYGINATQLREIFFHKDFHSSKIKDYVSDNLNKLLQEYQKTEEYNQFVQEQSYISNYKKQFQTLPYPPVFVTGDACVFNQDKVLLIKRKNSPGKGLWALPGGFLDQKESVYECAKRELIEETSFTIKTTFHYLTVDIDCFYKETKVFDHPSRSLRGRVITHCSFFSFSDKDNEDYDITIKANDDAEDVQWIDIDHVMNNKSMMFDDHWEVIRFFKERM
jgi:bifunctional NMN adenylyltransferase/nudix hydrolase